MGKLFLIGDAVRHHIYGEGEVLSVGYYTATVRFLCGVEIACCTDNITLMPY
jgi:hypothetical protein